MAVHSFLPDSAPVLRSMVQGIMESYENPWDLAAELAQNSVDAIRAAGDRKGKIVALLQKDKGIIEWRDNGTGINPDFIDRLFVIYGTDKRGKPNSIGEKGVGLKFVIFSSNHFELVSHSKTGPFKVVIESAADWLRADSAENITFSSELIEPDGSEGVHVKVTLCDVNHPLMQLSHSQMTNLLLVKTAIGSTRHIWESAEPSDCLLRTKEINGIEEESEFPCNFRLPIEDSSKKISIDDFQAWNDSGLKADDQIRRKLKDTVIYNSGTYSATNRDIKYWSCMMPTRTQWKQLAFSSDLIEETQLNEPSQDQEQLFFILFGGVYLATKGMPTGVTIDLRASGEAGYTGNFFIILDDDTLSFDIGRKGIPGRTAGVLRDIAQKEFLKYRGFRRFLRGEASKTNAQFERDNLFDSIRKLPDLKSDQSRFRKRPNNQEATVAAIFYEQLGRGRFPGFNPYVSGYRDRYDLTGEFSGNKLVVEFKFDLSGMFADFSINRKMFDEVNVVVVWEITEQDHQKAENRNIDISVLTDEDRIFPESNAILSIGDVAPIEVVQLKKILGL